MMWYDGWGWGGMLFGGLMMLIFLGGLIALIVWAVSRFSGSSRQQPPSSPSTSPPLEIAKTRYAKGDISSEEFEQLKKDIVS